MSSAHYCDRCEDLFAGPPQTIVATGGRELELCPDCNEQLTDWWESADQSDGKPVAEIDAE